LKNELAQVRRDEHSIRGAPLLDRRTQDGWNGQGYVALVLHFLLRLTLLDFQETKQIQQRKINFPLCLIAPLNLAHAHLPARADLPLLPMQTSMLSARVVPRK